jgi:hypothetical protein
MAVKTVAEKGKTCILDIEMEVRNDECVAWVAVQTLTKHRV